MPVGDHDHRFSSWAGAVAVIFSAIFVFAVLVLLYIQVHEIENSTKITSLEQYIEDIPKDDNIEIIKLIGQLYMESDAQFLRSERSQSLVGARLTVMILAEIVGLSLIVLGGAMVFSRVRGQTDIALEQNSTLSQKIRTRIASEFPGLLMCLFGSLVVIFAVNASIKTKIETRDGAIYFPSNFSSVTNIDNDIDNDIAEINDICQSNAPPELCL
ncbi:MAG: hypothetical protein RLT05_35440 [Bauldia litoralis]